MQASVYRAALAVARERSLLVVALLAAAVLVVTVVYRRSTVEW